ncbi:MAG: prepilin-type N-terminal cleavage/methylation domain-containing protein [Nitrospirae bacterium]|nr:prepilin-type N-terminal cleavage/methylation domain-containing protein [Nitrospirota bacterium]
MMRRGPLRKGTGGAGFTLLEIMVAVAIMVLIVTVVVPQIGDLAQVQLRSATRRLAGTVRHVYFEALLTKQDYILNYDLDRHEYWVGQAVFNPELNAIEQIETKRGLGRRHRLPPGIEFASVEAADRPSRSSGMELTFFSHLGVAEPTVIELRDQKRREVRLEVAPYAGRVTVGKP